MNAVGSEIWRAVLDGFARLRGQRAAELWLQEARPSSFRRGLFTLELPSASAKAAVDARYLPDLEELFRQLTGSPVRVLTRLAAAEELAAGARGLDALDLAAPGGGAGRRPVRPAAVHDLHGSFVITSANRLAVQAGERFLQSSEAGWNPLFVHGPAGSGKTAFARWMLGQPALHQALVLSGEALVRDVSRSARTGRLAELQRHWTGHDALVLDEAHRLAGRKHSQSLAASLVGQVLARGGRVLICARHAPRQIQRVDLRLQSHFLAGMCVALGEPSTAERAQVLQSVVETNALQLGAGVCEELAARCPRSLGDAVQLLRRMVAEARRDGLPLDVERVGRWLGRPGSTSATLALLFQRVAEASGVPIERIRSPSKSRPVVDARHLCIHLAHRALGLSARQVCRHFNLGSPSVVAYARQRIERRRRAEPDFDRLVLQLQAGVEGAQRDLPW